MNGLGGGLHHILWGGRVVEGFDVKNKTHMALWKGKKGIRGKNVSTIMC